MSLKKSVINLATIAAISAAFSSAALAEDSPWSIGVSALATDVDTIDTSSDPVAGVARTLDIGTDSDAGFGINIGRTLVERNIGRLRVELAYQNSEQDVENINFLGTEFSGGAVGGDVEIESIFARLAYEFELGYIDPYVGIGIGSTDVDVNAVYGGSASTVPGTQPPFITDNDSGTSFEARVGAKLRLSDRFDLFLEYSRVEVEDILLDRLGGGPGGLQTTSQEGDVELDIVSFGVSLNF